jgi:hypothetical protein
VQKREAEKTHLERLEDASGNAAPKSSRNPSIRKKSSFTGTMKIRNNIGGVRKTNSE